MSIYSYSLQGRRESNEDKHIHIMNMNGKNKKMNRVNFIGVFDGHGGKLVSKYLKNNLPKYFVNKFKTDIYQKNAKAVKYFEGAFDIIQKNLENTHPRAVKYCGSTALCGIQFLNKSNNLYLWMVNVGDSRAIMCNSKGLAVQLTKDHKPNSPEEKRRIEQLGGKIKYDGSDWRIKDLSLSRAFGDCESKPFVSHMPQIYKYKIGKKDKFIIFACDGLWDAVSNQDAVSFISNLKKKNYKGNYAKKLSEYAIKQGSYDNVTSVVMFLI